MFLRKKGKDEKVENYPIFMAIAEHIGYDAAGREDPINELETIYEEYQKFSKTPKNYKGY
jgi:type I restriction enzyme M protein